MKKTLFLLVSCLTALSCSDKEDPDPLPIKGEGSRLKTFSSCAEIGHIASDAIYNRNFNEQNSRMGNIYFNCEWQETFGPTNPHVFVGVTNISADDDLGVLTPEQILTLTGSTRITHPRLNHPQYQNIIITKNYSESLPVPTHFYTLYIWTAGAVRTERVYIRDMTWGEPKPALSDDIIIDIFTAMLEPAS